MSSRIQNQSRIGLTGKRFFSGNQFHGCLYYSECT